LLGFVIGGAAIVVAFAVGVSQAAGGRACAAVLSAAGQPGTIPGTATHYVLQGLPNCSYPSPPANQLFVALPPDQYDSAAACGGYMEVNGPDGSVRVEVIDQCPPCGAGHIDLSEAAFSAIAPLNPGLISVTYQYLVNPPLPGPVSLRVKETSSQYWLALLVMNTGNPLASVQLENQPTGSWYDLAQANYNYWVASSGAGTGPFTVRITDSAGHVVTVSGITLSPAVVQQTGTWMYGAGTTTVAGPAPSTAAPSRTPSPAPASPTPSAARPASASPLASRTLRSSCAGCGVRPGPRLC
jgi:expansin (peptidoglycan-binding protein)